jgi:hypothetical protein
VSTVRLRLRHWCGNRGFEGAGMRIAVNQDLASWGDQRCIIADSAPSAITRMMIDPSV